MQFTIDIRVSHSEFKSYTLFRTITFGPYLELVK
jgi:hypothetical protein